MEKTNLIIDTNVIVSAFLSSNENSPVSIILFDLYKMKYNLFYSDLIFLEYKDVLNRPKFNFDKKEINQFLLFIKFYGIKINPLSLRNVIMIDEKDRPFLELFFEIKKFDSYLITGNLKHYPFDSNIVSPRIFIESL